MIAGTNFNMVRFSDAWPRFKEWAGEYITAEAVEEARHWPNVSLVNEDGLLVLTLKPGHNGLRAFVILALSSGKHFGAFHRNEAGVVEIARDMGARTLAFRSDRRGWGRVLGRHWWRDGDLYERRVV